MVPIKIRLDPNAKIPEYKSPGASGADIYALVEETIPVNPGDTVLVPTGIYIEIPDGYEAQIRPRSGLALKHGITLLNTPGTIDSDYRGEIKIILTNLGKEIFNVTNGMRIAQMIFNKTYKGHFINTDELNTSQRNDGGFGHSGL